jgi:hypothetical protein
LGMVSEYIAITVWATTFIGAMEMSRHINFANSKRFK